jgi:hypothetical protein
MSHAIGNAVSSNWDRAKTFAKLAGVKPGLARSYIATLPDDQAQALAEAKRRDNPNLAPHLEAVLSFTPPERQTRKSRLAAKKLELGIGTTQPTRRSLGNPTQPPRAGAPTFTSNGHTLLIALRELCINNGGIDKVQAELDTLRAIQF